MINIFSPSFYIYEIKKYLYNRRLKKRFLALGMDFVLCHNCGKIWAEWLLPHNNFVCDYCVGSYGHKYITKKVRLETLYKMRKGL